MTTGSTPRKRYAIMRFAKIKSFATLARVGAHNTRAVGGENIREGAPPPRELLENGSDDFVASARALLDALDIDRRGMEKKVLAVETVTTASRAWFDAATDEQKQEWLDVNVAWAREKFGRGLMTAKLHLDEEVWHIHFVALPVVEKANVRRGAPPRDPVKRAEYERSKATAAKRWTLSYHDVLGGAKERLSLEQDGYHAAVAHLGLDRGETQRDDVVIEIGDELTISALALSRGQNADGTSRPRRSMTPAEGRAEVKRLRREAEADRHLAEIERQKSDNERQATQSAREQADIKAREATEELQRAIARREEGDALAREAQQKRDELVVEQFALERQQQALDAAEGALARERGKIAEALASASEARRAAEKARTDMDAARIEAERLRETAAARLADVEKVRLAAASYRDKAGQQYDAAAAARASLDAEQATHSAQLALIARAMDENTNLRLKATEKGLSMNTGGMSDGEWANYNKPWSQSLIMIGRRLVKMMEDLKARAASLLLREKAVEDRDAALTLREQAAERDLANRRDAQRREHERALVALDQRGEDLRAMEESAASRLIAADTKLAEAGRIKSEAGQTHGRNLRWAVALDVIGKNPEAVWTTGVDSIRVDPRVAASWPTSVVDTVQEPVPSWAMSVIAHHRDLEKQRELVVNYELDARYAAERLTEMVERAGPVLTPAQQQIAVEAQNVVKQWAPARQGPQNGPGR